MALFNSFDFDGINSLEYGVYITGEAVFNAPERAMEMVSIPGRNGALAIDYGRYENIIVTYPAGMFADNQADFAEKIRTFRNKLVSRHYYVKIVDTYHPDEYRLGLYRSGLEVDSVMYNSAGEFAIEFECKPQRFLIDGTEPIDIEYEPDYLTDHNLEAIETHLGDKIETGYLDGIFTNPSEFNSDPLIMVPGPGGINLNGTIIGVGGDGSKPIYIDADIGAIYTEDESGNRTNASQLVRFEGHDLPKVVPGENSMETDIDGVEITPRWWIL